MHYNGIVNAWSDEDDFCITQAMLDEERRLEMKHLISDRSPDCWEYSLIERNKKMPKIIEQADQMKQAIGRGFIIDFNEVFPIGSELLWETKDCSVFKYPFTCTYLKRVLHFPHTATFKDMRKFGFILCKSEILKIYKDLVSKKTIAIYKWNYVTKEFILVREYGKFLMQFQDIYPCRTQIYRRIKGVQREVFKEARDKYNIEMATKVKVRRGADKKVRKAELFTLSCGKQTTAMEYAEQNGISKRHAYTVLRRLKEGGK
jgi:hypothetical protein